MKTVKQLIKSGDLRPFTVEYDTPDGTRTVTGLLSEERVNHTKDLEGKYLHDIRHSDNDFCDPATIENQVTVNWFGTLILNEPFTFPKGQDYVDIVDYSFEDE